MTPNRIAPVAIALALAGVATAVSATTVVLYPDGYVVHSAEDVQVERLTLPEVVTYNDRYVTSYDPRSTAPAYVDTYTYVEPAPRESIIVQADPLYGPRAPVAGEYNPRHPHWGHLIDYGLFNRKGPNDFGR